MNRAEMSWALSAVLPHAGRYPRPSFVGLEHRGDWLYVYTTDRYTLAIARIPCDPFKNVERERFAEHTLSVKESTELERYVRPNRVAEKDEKVLYAVTDNELHIGLADESAVFEASSPDGEFEYLLGLVNTARGTAVEWQPVTVDPAYLARFAKAKRGDGPVRIEPKAGNQSGALLITAGEDFIGLAMGIAYAHPLPAVDFTSWPFPERKVA